MKIVCDSYTRCVTHIRASNMRTIACAIDYLKVTNRNVVRDSPTSKACTQFVTHIPKVRYTVRDSCGLRYTLK